MGKRFHRSVMFDSEHVLSPLVNLWLLRMLVPLNAQQEFITIRGFNDDSVAASLGLGDWIDGNREFDARAVRAELRCRYEAAERSKIVSPESGCLFSNVERLATVVGLNDIERRVLVFAVMVHSERVVDQIADCLGPLTASKVVYALSVVLALPTSTIRDSLSLEGALFRSGLLSVDRSGTAHLSSKLTLLSLQFAEHISMTDSDPIGLLRNTVRPSTAGHLSLSDFEHLAPSLEILIPYLRQSLTSGRRGVNICLHGRPGTGKNQLAKALAASLGCNLYEVASEDSDGDPVSGDYRLRALRAAQNFLTQQRQAILLFDEVEDVFGGSESFFDQRGPARHAKAWINRALEHNAVPTIWLTNSLGGMDVATIRRFDMVVDLPVPPKRQRQRIIQSACAEMLDDRAVGRMADSEELSPAVVSRAAAIIRTVSGELGVERSGLAIERLVNYSLQAQGQPPIQGAGVDPMPSAYDPALIQADADLLEVASGLQKCRSGRLCLYGPPGTGKTAFAKWIADQLGAPLHVKRASDLMSKWVGGNERNIADAFGQATRDGAVLLIDEIDSFLPDRRGAHRSWEVSLVNEMLTQMETFDGIFIASTNLLDGLDQASLRRFDLKVGFDYLGPNPAWELLCRYCDLHGLAPPDQSQKSRLARLARLTPGDFATVGRQARFRKLATASDLVAALEAECTIKMQGSSGPLGFI